VEAEAPAVGEVRQEAFKDIQMICPKCQVVKLMERKAKGKDFTVGYCRKCKGLWFDRDELEEVMPTTIKELEVPGNAVKKVERLCPKCEKALYEFDYPQTYVTIGMCKKCRGLWLDAGQFKEIQAVRNSLKQSGELKEYADVPGVRGALIGLIDLAIGSLQASIEDFWGDLLS